MPPPSDEPTDDPLLSPDLNPAADPLGDPEFTQDLLECLFTALPTHPADTEPTRLRRRAATVSGLHALDAREPIEAMLAAHALLAHHAAMDSYRRAGAGEMPPELAGRLRGNAAMLSRTFCSMLHALNQRQAPPVPAHAEPEEPAWQQ